MITPEKSERTAQSPILRHFQIQEYRFTIPKSRTRLAEKREELTVGKDFRVSVKRTFLKKISAPNKTTVN